MDHTHVTRIKIEFVVQTIGNGGYHYAEIPGSEITTTIPPEVGDTLTLPGDSRVFRVAKREWNYPHPGSQDKVLGWVDLQVILEEAPGVYADEEPFPDEA